MNTSEVSTIHNERPEDYAMPITEAVKLGPPFDAINCAFARLQSTLTALTADGSHITDQFTLNHTHVMNLLWAVEGHANELQYLFEVLEAIYEYEHRSRPNSPNG